jgi:hypothetical protein
MLNLSNLSRRRCVVFSDVFRGRTRVGFESRTSSTEPEPLVRAEQVLVVRACLFDLLVRFTERGAQSAEPTSSPFFGVEDRLKVGRSAGRQVGRDGGARQGGGGSRGVPTQVLRACVVCA